MVPASVADLLAAKAAALQAAAALTQHLQPSDEATHGQMAAMSAAGLQGGTAPPTDWLKGFNALPGFNAQGLPARRAGRLPAHLRSPPPLATQLLGQEVVAPLLARLVFAVGILSRSANGGDAGDGAASGDGGKAAPSPSVAAGAGGMEEAADGDDDDAARVHRVVDHLRSLVTDLTQEAAAVADGAADGATAVDGAAAGTDGAAVRCLQRLAALEGRLLRDNDVPRFEALGLPQSRFSAFVAEHAGPDLLEWLAPPPDQAEQSGGSTAAASGWASRGEAASVLAALTEAVPEATDEELTRLMVAQFGHAAVAASNAPLSLAALRRRGSARDAAPPGPAPPLPRACVLAAAMGAGSASPLGQLGREHAVRAIQRAPLLENLEDATQWSKLFEPSQGNLLSFCRAAEELAPVVIELSHGALIRVAAGQLSDYRDAVSALQAPRALALALYICAQARQRLRSTAATGCG